MTELQFVLGNISREAARDGKTKYAWSMFLEAGKEAHRIQKVVFRLHETFKNPEEVVRSATPNGVFVTGEHVGCGTFEVWVEIHWRPASVSLCGKTTTLSHELSFDAPRVAHTVVIPVVTSGKKGYSSKSAPLPAKASAHTATQPAQKALHQRGDTEEPMQILLQGLGDLLGELQASTFTTVAELKELIEERHGISARAQRLTHEGTLLSRDEQTLAAYGMNPPEATITVVQAPILLSQMVFQSQWESIEVPQPAQVVKVRSRYDPSLRDQPYTEEELREDSRLSSASFNAGFDVALAHIRKELDRIAAVCGDVKHPDVVSQAVALPTQADFAVVGPIYLQDPGDIPVVGPDERVLIDEEKPCPRCCHFEREEVDEGEEEYGIGFNRIPPIPAREHYSNRNWTSSIEILYCPQCGIFDWSILQCVDCS